MKIKNLYLFSYNLLQNVGWTAILIESVRTLIQTYPACLEDGSIFWSRLELWIFLFQGLTILEVIHAIIGLVRSGWNTALLQFFGRGTAVFVAHLVITEAKHAPATLAVIPMVLAWAVADIPRYAFYALNVVEACPAWLKWLRYSAFLGLYPIGATSEVFVHHTSLAWLHHYRLLEWHGYLPMYWFVYFGRFLFVPGFPYIFYHMIKQRRKQLKPEKKKKAE